MKQIKRSYRYITPASSWHRKRPPGVFFGDNTHEPFFPPALTASYIQSLNDNGDQLPAATRRYFGAKMNRDFGDVKIHTGQNAAASATAINAKAYTLGNHIVFNEGMYNPQSPAGKKLLAHELVHTVQEDEGCVQRDKLPAAISSGWQSTKDAAWDSMHANKTDDAENNFVKLLNLLGESKVNIARDGYNNPEKLKPGINFDIMDTHASGTTGYLAGNAFTGRLPIATPTPESAIVFNSNTFSTSLLYAISVIAHEKQHLEHQHMAAAMIEKMLGNKPGLEKFNKDAAKQEKEFRKTTVAKTLGEKDLGERITEIKAGIVRGHYASQKGVNPLDVDLLYGQTSTQQGGFYDTEVLSDLTGFMSVFHFVEIKAGKPSEDIFFQLTGYAAGKAMWPNTSNETKKYFKEKITEYFCKKLDADHQKLFKDQVTEYGKRKWATGVDWFFRMLAAIKCS